jgi:hypothetical protein
VGDFVLNAKQIFDYPLKPVPDGTELVLLQEGPGAGAYVSTTVADLVANALLDGGMLHLQGGGGGGITFNGSSLTLAGGAFTFSSSINAPVVLIGGDAAATVTYVNQQNNAIQTTFGQAFENLVNNSVRSFNFRTGAVQLLDVDILRAGGVLALNGHLFGQPTAPTPWDARQCDDTIATTAFVQNAICFQLFQGGRPLVFSFNGRSGCVTLTTQDVNAAFATFTPGVYPSAPSPPLGDASTRIATTAFVDETLADAQQVLQDAIDSGNVATENWVETNFAPINSPQFTGIPTGPTANAGTSTGQLATTAFVEAAVTASTTGVASFNTRTGAVTLTAADITAAGGALLASPVFTGSPQAPTAAPGTSTAALATTAFVQAAVTAATSGVSSFNTRTGAVTLTVGDVTGTGVLTDTPLAGVPTAPTPAPANNTTQLATTAFVHAAIAALPPAGVSSFNSRTGAVTLQASDVSAVGGALVASPTFTGTPTAPTAAIGTNSAQLATCAFVMAEIGSLNFAPLASPAFTGTPTAPTAVPATNNTQLATTAFVMAAVSAVTAGVSSFNTRTGAVTLIASDVTATGVFTNTALAGTPTAPTATAGTSTTQLATTAFVTQAIAAAPIGVSSFNSRTGAITLLGADVSAAGGALLASPTFTGTPAAPTPTAASNDTSLATTAWVTSKLATAGGVTSFNNRAGVVTLTEADIFGTNGAIYRQAATAPTGTPNTLWLDTSFTPPRLYARDQVNNVWCAAGPSIIALPPQVFTATGAVGWTPPANMAWAEVEVLGGGGGGASFAAGSPGSSSSFFGGTTNIQAPGGAGGAGTASGPATGGYLNLVGAFGNGGQLSLTGTQSGPGGQGGSGPFGGGGYGAYNSAGGNGSPNTGSAGGGGCANPNATSVAGAGGQAGAYARGTILPPFATGYTISVGGGGPGQAANANFFAGGNGANGIVIVKPYALSTPATIPALAQGPSSMMGEHNPVEGAERSHARRKSQRH